MKYFVEKKIANCATKKAKTSNSGEKSEQNSGYERHKAFGFERNHWKAQ